MAVDGAGYGVGVFDCGVIARDVSSLGVVVGRRGMYSDVHSERTRRRVMELFPGGR